MVRRQVRGLQRNGGRGLVVTLDALAPRFRAAAHAAAEAYDRLGVPYALIGGVAVGAYSEPRTTRDVDFLVGHEAFETRGPIVSFRSGIPLEAYETEIDNVPIHVGHQVAYEAALATAVPSDEPGIVIVQPQYLAFLKLVAGRRRDIDAVGELLRHGLAATSVLDLIAGHTKLLDAFALAMTAASEDE
jgi:hypothetical protein